VVVNFEDLTEIAAAGEAALPGDGVELEFGKGEKAHGVFDMRNEYPDRYVISNMVGSSFSGCVTNAVKFNVVYGPLLTDVLTRYTGNPNLVIPGNALQFLIYPTTNSSFTVHDGTSIGWYYDSSGFLNVGFNHTGGTAQITFGPDSIGDGISDSWGRTISGRRRPRTPLHARRAMRMATTLITYRSISRELTR
jgi:hypothetical protein